MVYKKLENEEPMFNGAYERVKEGEEVKVKGSIRASLGKVMVGIMIVLINV